MADNYLERKMEAYLSGRPASSHPTRNLDALVAALCSAPLFNPDYIVHPYQLQSIISIWSRCGISGTAGLTLLPFDSQHCAPLKELLPRTEANAFIVICADGAPDLNVGMAAQTLMLKAAELGLGALIINDFPAAQLQSALALEHAPALVLAIGKRK